MKFYNERTKYAEIQNTFLYRKGAILDRLVGINTHQSNNEFTLQPIYHPLLRFEKQGDTIFIDAGWNTPKFTVVLLPNFPFVQFLKAEKVQVEDL